MEVVDILLHLFAEDRFVDELSRVGCYGEVFEAEAVVVGWVVLDHNDVFDSDSEFSVVVVAWFVGDAHAGFEWDFVWSRDADWTLVYVEHGTDTVACSVLVVEAYSEEMSSSKDIEVSTGVG